MWRKTASSIVGPLVWLFGYGVIILIAIAILGLSSDNHISMGFIVFISASLATYLAIAAMEKTYPAISGLRSYLTIAIFAFVWIGSSVVSAIFFNREDEFVYRLVSLILSQIGIALAWSMKTRE